MRAKRVLFIGNLVEVKGVDQLLLAWWILTYVPKTAFEVELFIIGEGSKRQALERQVKDLGIMDSVRFAGSKPHQEIGPWLRSADCLCLPSRSEGMPNVVLEALACGVPVVASGVGEIPFLIRDGVNGFIVPQGEGQGGEEKVFPHRLAEALAKALTCTWNAAAIMAGVRTFTWERAAQTVVDAISGQRAYRH